MTSCSPVCMSLIRYAIDIITGICIYPRGFIRGFIFCLQKCGNIGALVISLTVYNEHN